MMKRCCKCKKEQEFYKNKARSNYDGLANMCKVCCAVYGRDYRKKNKHIVNEGKKKWQEANIEKYRAMARKCYHKNYQLNYKSKRQDYIKQQIKYIGEYYISRMLYSRGEERNKENIKNKRNSIIVFRLKKLLLDTELTIKQKRKQFNHLYELKERFSL